MAKYMTEYIDKEKAIYLVEKAVSKADAMMALLRMDPADVVPVRRGRWIRIPQEEMFCCDQCGRRGLSFDEFDVFGYTHDPFCADCGARMDGEQA